MVAGRATTRSTRSGGPAGRRRWPRPCRTRCDYAGSRPRKAGRHRGRPARGEAGCGGDHRSGLDRLAVEHPRRRRAVHPVRARLRAGRRRRALRAVHGPGQAAAATRDWLGNGVAVRTAHALPGALARLAGKRCASIAAGSPVWFAQRLRAAGARWSPAPDPCLLPKACKNTAEQQGARDAHARDAVAVCRFLHWLARSRAGGTRPRSRPPTTAGVPREVAGLPRRELPGDLRRRRARRDHPLPRHRPRPTAPISPNEVYLIDCGAQFLDGTTDITRTIWTGPGAPAAEIARARARGVMQGHIAIATLRFPQGVGGVHLDAFARRALWQVGLDYDHGTGHGVGSYLSVHEGPVSMSRAGPAGADRRRHDPVERARLLPARPPTASGWRTCCWSSTARSAGAAKPFLRFETLTLAPFDRELIEPGLARPAERAWLDAYHARVARGRAGAADRCPRLAGSSLRPDRRDLKPRSTRSTCR